jgi:hypothetical protein
VVVVAVVLVARSARPSGGRGKVDFSRAELKPRQPNLDVSGYLAVNEVLKPWRADATLAEIAREYDGAGRRGVAMIDAQLADFRQSAVIATQLLLSKAAFQLYDGEAEAAYDTLAQARLRALSDLDAARETLATVIFVQGVAALRRGENDNCIACRGESSCIVPIAASAVHTNPEGSRLAVKHFKEYLELFPDDVGVRWLLEVAYMTLGESALERDPKFRPAIDRFFHSEFDIGAFRDKGHEAGLDRFNQAGGAIMDDFDGDGRLDLVTSSTDPAEHMAFYRNRGDGTFEDRTKPAGLSDQLGGLVCYQGDYDNDGRLDVFVPRGAWLQWPVRPSLLKNDGAGAFKDVTREAGLLDPVNSNAAAWADYDNDGRLDLYIACERQFNRLYHNKGDGTFEEVAASAGVEGAASRYAKGCNWIDYDNDGYPDLFVNNLESTARLYHNERNGRFTDVTEKMGIDGPTRGFACWAWDYDNDGWLDIFAACYARDLSSIVKGMIGEPHDLPIARLFRNLHGQRFENITTRVYLGDVYSPMGSNFADFDNDGWLDFYLGTGEPTLATLVPNRMFKNVGGARFADITGSSGTGHLQKGHAVACGDWDRDGDVDLFIEMGGAIPGDKYHNILFQNPGQGNHWLTVKLVGKKTNRSAIGARIKVVTAGAQGRAIHRHVSSGSSFGANPLEQTIGLADAKSAATLEIFWPASRTTQVFHDVAADQAILINEFDADYERLDWKPLPQPD